MTERVALNLRLPKSLHRGLVALAEREYRSLNDQIVAILARSVVDQLDPQRDDLPTIVKRFVVATEPFMLLWERRYPAKPPRAAPIPIESHGVTELYYDTAQQRIAHQRLEAASAELVQAFRAWEQALGPSNIDTGRNE
jgi:hypothetical protein